jgi:uncharacterized membrane protein YqjE
MAVPTRPGDPFSGDEGFINNLRVLAASVVAYLAARLQLAGIESKEAAVHGLKIVALLAAGVFGFVFGYIFFCIAVVFLASYFLAINWMWILLAAGLLHFAGAAVALLIARAKFSRPLFEATIAEFKKDQTWLNTPKATTKPN